MATLEPSAPVVADRAGLAPAFVSEASGLARCPVCDSPVERTPRIGIVLRHIRGSRRWSRCDSCKSFFAAAPFDADHEVAHVRTRAWGRIETAVSLGEAKAPLFDAVLRLLRRIGRPGPRLLDVGCSYGTFLQKARAAGYEVRGVDIVPEAVEYVRGLGIACEQAASMADVSVPPASQDVITVLDCNCYWPDHRRELREIHSRLRPGGLLAMRVVDTSWAVRLGLTVARVFPDTGRRLCERVVYDHHVSIPAASLLQLLSQEGFDVIRTSVRAAVPFRHNTLKARISYGLGDVVWRLTRRNVAPGLVLLARKQAAGAPRAGSRDAVS